MMKKYLFSKIKERIKVCISPLPTRTAVVDWESVTAYMMKIHETKKVLVCRPEDAAMDGLRGHGALQC